MRWPLRVLMIGQGLGPFALWVAAVYLLRCRPPDDLYKIIGTDPFGKGRAHVIRAQFVKALRGALGFVERETDLCAAHQGSGDAVFTRLPQRKLPQNQRLGEL